jgi:hypothetical protein
MPVKSFTAPTVWDLEAQINTFEEKETQSTRGGGSRIKITSVSLSHTEGYTPFYALVSYEKKEFGLGY